MITARQVAFVNGVMSAQYEDIHPDAWAETVRALSEDNVIVIPDGVEARVGFANGGDWFTIDCCGGHTVNCVYRSSGDDSFATELITMALADGATINAAALSEAFRLAPITITWLRTGPGDLISVSELVTISNWVGAAMSGVSN